MTSPDALFMLSRIAWARDAELAGPRSETVLLACDVAQRTVMRRMRSNAKAGVECVSDWEVLHGG